MGEDLMETLWIKVAESSSSSSSVVIIIIIYIHGGSESGRDPLLTHTREAMSKPRLERKVAIITGAASGIGEAAARLFAANGATVVIADVQDKLGLQVAASIGAPDKCCYRHCDVTDEKQVEATVDYALATYGRLDIMYSNAGILGRLVPGLVDISTEDFERVVAVNVRGTALAIKHAARAMLARGVRGSIVCTASVAGHQGGHGTPVYTASKHAVVGLVKAAAADLGWHGIRVNSVSPFMVATGMSTGTHGATADTVEEFSVTLANLKGGGALKAAHVAEAAMFLASEESAFVSGHDLVVDGGTSVVYPNIMPVIMATLGLSKM